MPNLHHIYKSGSFAFLLIVIVVLSSCTTTELSFVEITDDSLYRSHTQSENLSNQITENFRSVRRIQSTVFYRTYQYDPENPPLESELRGMDLSELAIQTVTDNHSSAGTALVLSKTPDRVGLLTAAHVVTYPDTVWHHVRGYEPGTNSPIEAVSVKENISYFIFGHEQIGSFELIVSDNNRDLAFLSTRLGAGSDSDIVPLSSPAGNSEQLEWADLVYAMGYPKGYQMVTTGIVSQNMTPNRRGFIIDASFNRGFSGGVVFAVRNDRTEFEWVGILTSAAAEVEYLLTPGYIREDDYDPEIEYTGSIYVNRIPRINYGITHATGINEIKDFFSDNLREIRRNGFSTNELPR
jgi:S1-C subfamily serine protease